MVGIPRPANFMQADTSIDSAAVVDDAIGAVDVSNSLVYDMEAKLTAVGADSVLINDSAASNINKKATLTVVAELMAGTVATSSIENTAGVLKVDIKNTTATTEAAAGDYVLTSVAATGVNQATTITNLAKPLGAVMAGVAATSGITEVDGVMTVAAKIAHLETALLKGITVVPMSFETNEQTTTRIYFNSKVTINKIRGIVMKAIAGSDNGTITCGNSTGDSASGVVTATASDALNVAYAVTPTTNNVVLADGYYQLLSAKSTAGGKVHVTLEWTKTA
jgi:hypothetical protein